MGALGALLVCEAMARVLAQQLPPPSGWPSREMQAQVARIEEVERDGGVCLAFLGSSTIEAAIDPEVLTAYLGHDGWYVAWVAGANALLLEPWTAEIVVPKLEPEYVVIGLTSMEINDSFEAEDLLDSYYESRARREAIGKLSLTDRAYRALEDTSAFVAMRQYLRSPGEVVARLTGHIPNVASKHGLWQKLRDRQYGDEAADMARARGYVDTYAVGGRTIETAERIVNELQSQGRAVALLQLPVLEEEWAALHEHGWSDLVAFREALVALGERQGVPVFAYYGILPDASYFRDQIHLSGQGPALFTRELAGDLRSWMDDAADGCGE